MVISRRPEAVSPLIYSYSSLPYNALSNELLVYCYCFTYCCAYMQSVLKNVATIVKVDAKIVTDK